MDSAQYDVPAGQEFNKSERFPVGWVRVDNLTTQWLQIPPDRGFIAPFTYGVIYPVHGLGSVRVVPNAPPNTNQMPALSGQQYTVTLYSAELKHPEGALAGQAGGGPPVPPEAPQPPGGGIPLPGSPQPGVPVTIYDANAQSGQFSIASSGAYGGVSLTVRNIAAATALIRANVALTDVTTGLSVARTDFLVGGSNVLYQPDYVIVHLPWPLMPGFQLDLIFTNPDTNALMAGGDVFVSLVGHPAGSAGWAPRDELGTRYLGVQANAFHNAVGYRRAELIVKNVDTVAHNFDILPQIDNATTLNQMAAYSIAALAAGASGQLAIGDGTTIALPDVFQITQREASVTTPPRYYLTLKR